MFIDFAKIHCKAGKGGNGVNSFYRDRMMRYPRRDGGDGGKGGDIIVMADSNKYSLLDFKYRKDFKGQNGKHGSSSRKKGREGDSCLILVPVGTVIRDAENGLLVRDLKKPADQVVVCRGGRPGRGNYSAKEASEGLAGEEKTFTLELKLIADAGLVGYPNAGKSTLISRISRAKPKIAGYPFTTLEPVLGVVSLCEGEKTFTVADIPGLIEGAHSGKGLGDRFLRHIERTRILVHIVDISDDLAYDNYIKLNRELGLYKKEVAGKSQIIVANKMDLPGSSEKLAVFEKRLGAKVQAVSAKEGSGLEGLIRLMAEKAEIVKE